MKKLVNVVEVDGEGLVSLLGENVILFCMNYFYAGKLAGVNSDTVKLRTAREERACACGSRRRGGA